MRNKILSSAFAAIAVLVYAGCDSGDASPGARTSIQVEVVPPAADVLPGGTVPFGGTVTGTANTNVLWSVVEAGGGSVNATGLYVAPPTTGVFHVRAASAADPSRTAQATVTVTTTPSVAVAVSPRTATIPAGGTLAFTAVVTGTANGAVTWSVQEGSAGGVVSSSGVYTASSTPGTYHVVATSQAENLRSASAIVTVTPAAGGSCGTVDACPAPNGVVWECEKRFMYGTNWAWRTFGGDFGGYSAWGEPGVAAQAASVDAEMRELKAAGVNVVRWWMFPHLSGDGIAWSGGVPSGIRGSMVADIQKALELANKNDLYLMLTPFSFDNFSTTNGPSLKPLVTNSTSRAALLTNLVGPVARAVEASPYKHRMVAWDMINEPEWAVSGASITGDPGFEPSQPDTITHLQMQTFLQAMTATLRANGTALVSIGQAAIKWPTVWKNVAIDFYQLHYYDWVYEYFPYNEFTLARAGLTDKPVVMGEFPIDGVSAISYKGLPARTASQFTQDLWNQGYAGALSWAFNDASFTWLPAQVKSFADAHACEVAY